MKKFLLLFFASSLFLVMTVTAFASPCWYDTYSSYDACMEKNQTLRSDGQYWSAWCGGCNTAWEQAQYDACVQSSITGWEQGCWDAFMKVECPSNQINHPETGTCIYKDDATCRGAFGEGATYDGNAIDGCACVAPSTWDGSYCHSADQQCGEGQIAHPTTGTCIWSSTTWCQITFGDGAYYDGNEIDGCICEAPSYWDGSYCHAPDTSAGGVFTDTGGNLYETAINYVYNNGIVNGYPDGSYGPDKAINRAEFTKIIMAASFDSSVITGSSCFPDIGNEWFAPYVCSAQSMGIIAGYSNGRFEPNNNINLAESLKIIFEGSGVDIPETGGAWYQKYIDIANQLGLLYTINSAPSHNLTRGEMAELIYLIDSL